MEQATFDAISGVPRPPDAQPFLDETLKQRGWWVSDNTMRTLREMGTIWLNDTCANECDGYSCNEKCPYGEDYATACVIVARIAEAMSKADEEDMK